MSREASQGPGVRCPPPLIFLGGLLASWGLDRRLAFDIDGSGRGLVQSVLGWALLGAGAAMLAWGLATLLRFRTTFHPDRPASHLVVSGPYRYSRNPIYVGMTAVYAGIALLANSAWPLLLLPAVLVILTTMVIGREERYLSKAFGGEYAGYCRRVRRWI